MKNILQGIERTVLRFPDRAAVADGETELSYLELLILAKRIGSHLAGTCGRGRPAAIYLDKTPACAAAMLGTAYSGNFYTVLDTGMPLERIGRIFETLRPAAVLTDRAHLERARAFCPEEKLVMLEDAGRTPVCQPLLDEIRAGMTAEDPLYVLYTSGSTGRPKGVVVSHRAALAYTRWAADTFGVDETTVFGSQTPFYFSMSVTDLYTALQTGARLQIIPPALFSFPLPLIEYLNRWRVNTLYWVPSALGVMASWDAFSYEKPRFVRKVLFAGERMPAKTLAYWRRFVPDALYADLFGPTETTDICTYYIVDRTFADDEDLPIGRPCDNCRALILDEEGNEADRGELYIGGPFLASGYYNDPEKTAAAFVRNPLNSAWPEPLYRTGDLVARGENGELVYLGRKDHQIKHLGYRIELGEIEAAAGGAEGVDVCACVYDETADALTLFYQGRASAESLTARLRERLPAYMLPARAVRLSSMPHNASGKIDRRELETRAAVLLGKQKEGVAC
ncbi:MAG: amino acid adenylation domain-containing protein [Oscillibacter sp.]|jgi:amino acid adenylation domain-containing protein|nr:amino acid adenylation domain-containing protein [Oscillibacter sp.]